MARPFDDAGQRFVDVTDPSTGKTFCFYDVEYYIACAMDGSRDVGRLVTWAEDELGLAPSTAELESVISTLDELGYLEYKPAPVELPADVELGDAGVSSMPVDVAPIPTAMDVELGSAGRSELAYPHDTRMDIPDVALGMAGRSPLDEPAPLDPVPLAAPSVPAMPPAPAPVIPPSPPADDAPELSMEDASHGFDPQPARTPQSEDRVATGSARPPRAVSTRLPAEEVPGMVAEPIDLTSDISSEFDDSEVSVDLTDHLSIGAADVKEAVRQSRIMQAPEAPDAERRPPPIPARTATPPIGAPAVGDAGGAGATELPSTPAKVSDVATARPVEPPGRDTKAAGGEKKSSLGLLLAILAVVALGAGAFGYWYLILKDRGSAGSTGPSTPTRDQPAANPEPPPPPPPTATLAEVPAEPVEVKAASTGYVAEIAGVDEQVEEGAVVVKLRGYQKHEKELAEAEQRLAVYQKRLEAAQKTGSASRIQSAEAKVKEKADLIEQSKEALAKLVLTAPVAGTVKMEFKVDDAVEEDAIVFRVEPPPVVGATFKVPGARLSAGDDVMLVADGAGKKVTCAVAEAEGERVTVRCGADGGLAAGDEVVLRIRPE